MAGFEADAGTLRGAAPRIFDASDQIGDAAATVRAAQVTPDSLGRVEGAGAFSVAVAAFAEAHGADLEHGSMWVNDAGDGLLKAAGDYERADADNAAGLSKPGGEQ
ncbi:MAG: hypothetical protein GEU98_23885 [Pseudonocardiaceae bacterium]|nr:hypothetical protein [Pseudonocardiaceae bacterium]